MIIECNNCNIRFKGEPEGSYTHQFTDDPIDENKYSIFKCPECAMPILTEQQTIFLNGYNEFGYTVPRVLYPIDNFHINPIIPEMLKNSLSESIKCFKSGAFSATVLTCRRTIEGFCHSKNINESNLQKSIEVLKNQKIINEQLYEWANHLRLIGNDAAHNVEVIFSEVDAKDSLDFTIAILDFTYSFKEKFENFKNRKGSN